MVKRRKSLKFLKYMNKKCIQFLFPKKLIKHNRPCTSSSDSVDEPKKINALHTGVNFIINVIGIICSNKQFLYTLSLRKLVTELVIEH